MNNEQAFPIVIDLGQGVEWHKGMTLRDYFAAKAGEEDIRNHIWKGHSEDYVVADGPGRKKILQREAKWTREEARYRYADAMLKARKQ